MRFLLPTIWRQSHLSATVSREPIAIYPGPFRRKNLFMISSTDYRTGVIFETYVLIATQSLTKLLVKFQYRIASKVANNQCLKWGLFVFYILPKMAIEIYVIRNYSLTFYIFRLFCYLQYGISCIWLASLEEEL